MRTVEPKVFLVGETRIIDDGLQGYLSHIGVPDWTSDAQTDGEKLIEVMGRMCYKSFQPGLNRNVRKIREHNDEYLANIVRVRHGSVLEHSWLNFIFVDVSRVFTHELVRHRAGTAMSQESLRFVRLHDLGMWQPLSFRETPEAMEIMSETFVHLEKLQIKLADLFKLDDEKRFAVKKMITSAMRRIAPIGLATAIGWSANFRAIRHVLEMRTYPGAEEEIRLVFGKVGEIVTAHYPNVFGDYEVVIEDNLPWYKTENSKV
jgi:thymidylate synthase (FAD)